MQGMCDQIRDILLDVRIDSIISEIIFSQKWVVQFNAPLLNDLNFFLNEK